MRTVVEVAEAVRRGELKAVEVLEECLSLIESRNGELGAFVHVDPELAHAQARLVDQAVARGEDPGRLAGVPVGIKDLEDCAGMPTTQGSLWYADGPPAAADSIHVARLRAAGAVPLGKTAVPEFGSVCFTSTKAQGVARNPWDTDKTPGGSSGGSASAVAAAMVPFCTASDGGGSTRIPAAFAGLVGMKPSFGRIPKGGSDASQTGVKGALTTTVADAARHLDVSAGPDERDRTTLPPAGLSYETAAESHDVRGLRVTWSSDFGFAAVDPEVEALARSAADALIEAAGLTRVDRQVSFSDPTRVWLGQGDLDLWLDVHHDGLFPERASELMGSNRAALEYSQHITLPRLAKRYKRRTQLQHEMAALFADVDIVLSPATAVPAFAATGPIPTVIDGREVHPAMAVPFTMPGNLCWNPAISLPAGLTTTGLPVGLQAMARRHDDHVVLRLGRILEEARPWPRFAPAYR